VARRLAAEGAAVTLVDVLPQVLDVAASIEGASGVVADVSDRAAVQAVVDGVVTAHGGVDILVNNAAIVGGAVAHFLELDESMWDRVIGVNLTGHYLCSHAVAQHMARAGSGVIVTMSSGGATRAHRGMVAYDASKGAIEAMTRAMALDLAPYGVRVVGIVPGLIGQEEQSAETLARTAATVPLGRPGTGDDVAAAVAFAVSDDAAYVTGSMITVDGAVLVQQRSPQIESFPVERFPQV
jgi:3-oxoacyl-[acyl-carrier protein] reductase